MASTAPLQRITITGPNSGPLGALGHTYEALFQGSNPVSLTVNTSVVVPDFLLQRNHVLYDHTQQIEGPMGELRSALMNLRRAAGAADVGHLIIGQDSFIHWQKPGEVVSTIGTLVTKLDAQGKTMKAPQAIIDVYDAARLVMRAAR